MSYFSKTNIGFKQYYLQNNELKNEYKILELKIKCMRFENIYSCSTYSHNNDQLKAMREKKDKMKLKFGVNMKIPRNSKKCDPC